MTGKYCPPQKFRSALRKTDGTDYCSVGLVILSSTHHAQKVLFAIMM
ncbi:MAG: hypothetical protein IJS39_04005 [Synergistaceae bacterium]|nr:hypothetical protein [Synergistaceae bacterium]